MIHRYIHDILTTGVQNVKDDIKLLEDLFNENYTIEATELTAIRTHFEAGGLNIYDGYPRADSVLPFVAIVLNAEAETTNFLADDAGQIEEVDDLVGEDPDLLGADVESAIWKHVYHLLIFDDHPDMTAAYYELTKSIMVAGLKALTIEGCFGYRMSGMDLAPDPNYLPQHWFGRRMVFEVEREFQRIARESLLGKAYQVSGIHVDSAGSPSDVGGVKTLVSPYAVGEDDD